MDAGDPTPPGAAPPSPEGPADRIVAGCRIEREIARGGMGVVYLAEHLHLGRKVALKVLSPAFHDDERFRERFARESRLAARLEHPNVIPVYDAGEADGVLYIAMRYVDGTDLAQTLDRKTRLAPDEALVVLEQAAAGLDAAHRAGLVHRDVKPGNILISRPTSDEPLGRVWVADFGLTRSVDGATRATQTGIVVGTLAYMASEQFEGIQPGALADVYSLACVLCECLTGTAPFVRDTDAAVMFAHLSDPPPRPSQLQPELPHGIDAVVARGLAKKPEDRYPTATAMIDAARTALEGEEIEGSAGKPRRGRAVFAAVGLLVAVAVAGAVLLARPGENASPAAGSNTYVYFVTVDDGMFRVRPVAGARVESIAPMLDRIAPATPSPGATAPPEPVDEWLSPSGDFTWFLASTERLGCRGYACLAVFPGSLSRGEVVRVEGEVQRGTSIGAINRKGDALVVPISRSGPHELDLVAFRREGREWSSAVITGTSTFGWQDNPRFTRDGRRVLFDCGRETYGSGGAGICEVGIDGKGFREVVAPTRVRGGTSASLARHAVEAPDGSLVFEADWGRIGLQLWRMPKAGGEPVRLTVDGRSWSPCLLPDGRIASLYEGPDSGEAPDIAVHAPDGSSKVLIARGVEAALLICSS